MIRYIFRRRALVVGLIFVLAVAGSAHAQSSPQQLCQSTVQGRIAWDYSGNTRWAAQNLERLCKGAPSPYEPARCFDRVMHGGVNWGGGTRWEWANALDLCAGATDARARITCFQRGIEAGTPWREAISACTSRSRLIEARPVQDLQVISGVVALDPANPFSPPSGDGGATKTILPDGSVEIVYPDGRRVRPHASGQTIIMPDGTEQTFLFSTAARPPIPPSAPSGAETTWLEAHSDGLLHLMRALVDFDEGAITNYLQSEGSAAGVYERIVAREQTLSFLLSE